MKKYHFLITLILLALLAVAQSDRKEAYKGRISIPKGACLFIGIRFDHLGVLAVYQEKKELVQVQ